MKKLYLVLLFLFSSNIFAQTLTETTFESQFDDQKIVLNTQVQWVFFSASKNGSEIMRDAFEDLKVDEKWLLKNKAIYVADIHNMPSLIARFFALPKMRDYLYPIALDKEGDVTDKWLEKGEGVTIYQLNNLNTVKTTKLNDLKSLTKFLNKNF